MLASIESADTIDYQRTDLLYNCNIYKFSCFMREPTSSAALGMRTRKVTKWSKKMGGVKKWVENLKRKKTIRIRRRAVMKQLGKKVVNRRVKGRRKRRKLTKRVRRVVVMLPWRRRRRRRRRIEQRRSELQAIIRRGRAECSTTWRELVYEDNNADMERWLPSAFFLTKASVFISI